MTVALPAPRHRPIGRRAITACVFTAVAALGAISLMVDISQPTQVREVRVPGASIANTTTTEDDGT